MEYGNNDNGKLVEYSMGPMQIESINPILNLQSNISELNLEAWKLNLLAVSQFNDRLYIASGKKLLIVSVPDFGRIFPPHSAVNFFQKVGQVEFPALITGLKRFQTDSGEMGEVIVGTCENGSFGIVIDNPPLSSPIYFFSQISPESLWGIDFFKDEWIVTSSNTHDAYLFPATDTADIQILEGNQHNIPAISFSLEGNYVASAGIDGTLRIFKRGEEGDGKCFTPSHDWGWSVGFINVEDLDEQQDLIDYSSTHIKFIRKDEELIDLQDLLEQNTLPPLVIYENYLDPDRDGSHLTRDIGGEFIRMPVGQYLLQELMSDVDEYRRTEPNHNDESGEEEESEIFEDPLSEMSDLEITINPEPIQNQADFGETERESESENHQDDEIIAMDQISYAETEETDIEEGGNSEEKPLISFTKQERPQLVYYLTSHDLYVYDFNYLLQVTDPNPTTAIAIYRILYSTVTPDQRAFFNNATLQWAHERYCFTLWSADLSCLILGNQLGFVSIVHFRRDRSEEEKQGKICVRTMVLTIPMGDCDVMPLAGIDLKRIDPNNPNYFHLYLLHLDGSLRIYLIRRLWNNKIKR
jgi:WD40 repeat protein